MRRKKAAGATAYGFVLLDRHSGQLVGAVLVGCGQGHTQLA
jgi:hypothetical protein